METRHSRAKMRFWKRPNLPASSRMSSNVVMAAEVQLRATRTDSRVCRCVSIPPWRPPRLLLMDAARSKGPYPDVAAVQRSIKTRLLSIPSDVTASPESSVLWRGSCDNTGTQRSLSLPPLRTRARAVGNAHAISQLLKVCPGNT